MVIVHSYVSLPEGKSPTNPLHGLPCPAPFATVLEYVDLLDLEAHVALQHDAMARSDALHNDLVRQNPKTSGR